MKTLDKTKKYLTEIDFTDYVKINKSTKHTLSLINRIQKGKLDLVIQLDEKNKMESYFSQILNEFKNFNATKNENIHLQIDYFVFNCYGIIMDKFEDFEVEFTKSVAKTNEQLQKSIKEVDGLKSKNIDTNKQLKSSLESCKKTNNELDILRKDAIKKVNDFATKIKDENQRKLNNKFVEINESVNEQKNMWNKKFDALDIKREKFEKLYEEATTYFRESRFDKYSDDEKKQANIYRKISIILMLFVVFFIVALTIYSVGFDKSNPKWYDYITRSLLIFTLMIPAIYTSRESSHHRRNSDKYTQMANELKAFKITLEVDDLDVEIKNRVKEEIYKRYFGNLLIDEPKDIGDSLTGFVDKITRKKE